MTRIQELQEELGVLDKESRAIQDKAEAEKRTMNAEENEAWDAIDAKIEAAESEIGRRRKQLERKAASSRPSSAGDLRRNPDKMGGDKPQDGPIEIDFGRSGTASFAAGTPEHARSTAEYAEAFSTYMTTGVNAGLQVSPSPKGGYLTQTAWMAELIQAIDDDSTMRTLARVLPPLLQATSLGVPSLDTDLADADWTPEVPAAAISEDDAMRFGSRELLPHLVTKLVKISQKLLRSGVLSPEAIVRERMAHKFAITENKAFLTGDGAQQPLGVFVASAAGISTGRDTTAAAVDSFTADELIDVQMALKGGYWAGATWLMHRDVLKAIRKLKDGNGQYLWVPGLAGGLDSTILGMPYVLDENAPNTFTTGLYMLLLGDFQRGYWIVDSLAMEIQVLMELYTTQNQVGYKGAKETDGMPVLEEAFSRLILG